MREGEKKRRMNVVSSVAMLAMLSVGAEEEAASSWAVPRTDYEFQFPRDHGSHPEFKIEWWYLTGHLLSGDRRFGFQATFFRLGQRPEPVPSDESFGDAQLYMAHMGLADPANDRFIREERLSRAGWDARAAPGDLDVRNGNWRLVRRGSRIELTGSVRAEAVVSLTLRAHEPLVVFGEDCVSRKGPEDTAASYYLTYPRLEARGTVEWGGETREVAGELWMDHEISSGQLSDDQVGWDWACIQFFDGRELMGYVLRTADGGVSEWSRLFWIDRKGKLTRQRPGDYRWIHDGRWESPETGAVYPVSPMLKTRDPESGETRRLRLRPLMKRQEIVGGAGGVSYWEGACDAVDEATGEVVGRAYLEMTGYADDIGERLR